MGNRKIVALGTSAGGVEALMFLARHLPESFPAAIVVTIHLPGDRASSLDEVLARSGPLQASFAEDGDQLRKGHFYIAPPDRHLLIEGERLVLGYGARENNSRPAIDAMLRSAAVSCAPCTIGVVLTGTLNDGAAGLCALHRCGGIVVVQDPADAAFAEMPANAIHRVTPDHVVPLADMPRLLTSLVHEPAGASVPVPDSIRSEAEIARGRLSSVSLRDALRRLDDIAAREGTTTAAE